MRPSSRIILALSALSLLASFFLPLWSISLEAPQYPEGIGMEIRVNTITGFRPHDLENINKLNHYIGMKRIEPDSIRELELMPWILGFLVFSGVTAAVLGRRWMLFVWLGLVFAAGTAGMVDFWLWGYDYGHNLDPTAAIKVPGMSYQPPLIGSKALLNFVAHSWPASGGLVVFGAGLLAALVGVAEVRGGGGPRGRRVREKGAGVPAGKGEGKETGGRLRSSNLHPIRRSLPRAFPVVVALLASVTMGCGPRGPVPIKAGEEECAHCLMTVADERYATELITEKGKVYFFDSVECLAGFYLTQDPEEVASMWVTDFHTQSRMIPVEEAFFLRSKDLRSPMGMNLTAFGDGIEPESVLNSFMGEILDWPQVVALLKEEGPPGAGMEGMHGGHGMGLSGTTGGRR